MRVFQSVFISTLSLSAGEYKMFTDVKLTIPIITALPDAGKRELLQIFPNPVNNYIECSISIDKLSLITMTGSKVELSRIGEFMWNASEIAAGFYIGAAEVSGRVIYCKMIKR